VRFLVDAQLPPALARRVEAWGHVAEHVFDLELTSVSDSAIRDYAANVGAVIITKDEDFAVRQVLTGGPPVVWLRLGNTRRAVLLERVGAEFPAVLAALERGDTLIEIS
jgi:predicted nuclease of predicted toxin-antitoxin system